MRWLDRRLQQARLRRARRWLERGDAVLDIGCSDGELFRRWDAEIGPGVGYDPDVEAPLRIGRHELRPGHFPDDAADLVDGGAAFDVVTLLAVLEHVPPDRQRALADACATVLRPGGRIVVTVPSPQVDRILDVLSAVRLIDGMHTEEHFGFRPSDTPRAFTHDDLELVTHRRFQLGLNHLFVFRRR